MFLLPKTWFTAFSSRMSRESQHTHFEDKIQEQVRLWGFPPTCASLVSVCGNPGVAETSNSDHKGSFGVTPIIAPACLAGWWLLGWLAGLFNQFDPRPYQSVIMSPYTFKLTLSNLHFQGQFYYHVPLHFQTLKLTLSKAVSDSPINAPTCLAGWLAAWLVWWLFFF